eukprot:1195372-Prorocentrum_minimum.AAC.3
MPAASAAATHLVFGGCAPQQQTWRGFWKPLQGAAPPPAPAADDCTTCANTAARRRHAWVRLSRPHSPPRRRWCPAALRPPAELGSSHTHA